MNVNRDTAALDTEPGSARGVARAHWGMIALVACLCAVMWNTERIPLADGLGWDGRRYAAIVQDPSAVVHDRYYVQRALPSWVVGAGLRGFGLPTDAARIIRGFMVWNVAVLLAGAALWRPIADRLRLTVSGRWLGFLGLFGGFALLRMPFYYPVLTDVSAFGLGMPVLAAALAGRRALLALLCLVSTVVWSIAALFGIVLLAWPPRPIPMPCSAEPPVAPGPIATSAAVAAALVFGALSLYVHYVLGGRAPGNGVEQTLERVLWLSTLGVVAYLYV